MLGVTLGIGEWREVAELSAFQMFLMTGMQCRVVTEKFCEAPHPSWLKAKIIEQFPHEDSFMVFDADIISIKKWSPETIFESLRRPFCAVLEPRSADLQEECKELGIPKFDIYVNGGLTIFGKEHKSIWDSVWARRPKCGGFLEQGALNLAMCNTTLPVCRLPRKFNTFNYGRGLFDESIMAMDVVNIHMAGCKNTQLIMEWEKMYIEYANAHPQ